MADTGASIVEIIIWIVLANFLLLAFLYGIKEWLKKKSLDNLARIAGEIHQHAGQANDIHIFLQNYESTRFEPFLTPVETLSTEMQDIETHLQELEGAAQAVQTEIDTPGNNQLRFAINAPFRWYSRFSQTQQLIKESSDAGVALNKADGQLQEIYEIPWQVAVQARQAVTQVDEMLRLSQNLKQKGVQGADLQSALARAPAIQRSLGNIPPAFYSSNQNDLLQTISLEETVRAYDVLTSAQPVISRWLPLLRTWDHHHQKTARELNNLRQTTHKLNQSLAQPPAGLQAAPIQQRHDTVMKMMKDLEKRMEQAEANELRFLQREATRLRKLAEDAGIQLNRAGQLASELSQALPELKTGIDTLSGQLASLEQSTPTGSTTQMANAQMANAQLANAIRYPLAWDESGPQLTALEQQLKSLGPAGQSRTPEQVSAALAAVQQMRQRLQELNGRYREVSRQYQSLIALLESPEIKEGSAWIRKNRETINLAMVYDPHNWNKPDTVETLKADLEALSAQQERLAGNGINPVKESGLPEKLKDTQQLASLHKAIRPRAAQLSARLEKVQALEKETKERLSGAWAVLERVSLLARSNELLEQIAAPEIKRLTEELQSQADVLNQRNQGVMEKKLQQVQAQTAAVYQAFQAWVARLNTENVALARQISDRLAELDAVGALNDPAFEEARQLLTHEDLRPSSSSLKSAIGQRVLSGQKSSLREPLSEQEASAEIKRKNDLWQSLLGAGQALEEKSVTVLQAYQETVEARTRAQEKFNELNAFFAQKRVWPPSNQAPLPENQGMVLIDAKWEAIRRQSIRSDTAILELGRLMNQYQMAFERAGQLAERINQDQDHILELEDQIEDLKERWSFEAQSAPDNILIYHGVQQLLGKTDSQMAYIRQQSMRGGLTYDEVVKSLRLLYDEVNTTRIPFDDTHDMGLPGGNRPNGRKPNGQKPNQQPSSGQQRPMGPRTPPGQTGNNPGNTNPFRRK